MSSKVLNFTVHGRAQPAGSKRFVGTSKAGRGIVIDANPRAADWKGTVAQVAAKARQDAGWELLSGAVEIYLVVVRARPKSHYRTCKGLGEIVKASAPSWPTSVPDASKCLRATEDSMIGIIYRDDSQIVSSWVQKIWGAADQIEVEICALEDK